MSKAPLTLVSRCRPAPSSPPRRAAMSTTPAPNESKLLAALSAMSLSELEVNKPPPVAPFIRAAPVWPRGATPRLLKPTIKKSLVRMSAPRVNEQRENPATTSQAEEPIEQPVVVPDLPVYSYASLSPAPTMRVARTEADADKWVQELDHTCAISMDCEWAVRRVKGGGGIGRVSVIQVADKKNILVIQLMTRSSSMARFPVHLQRLLENPDIPKMGANIMNDANKIFKDYGVMMANVVELGRLARQADPACNHSAVFGPGKRVVALAKLVSRYLQKTLLKEANVRVSDWEGKLSPETLEYAANDAYCGLEVYNHLMALAKANEITLDPTMYTGGIYHQSLASPPAAPEPLATPPAAPASTDPTKLPELPRIPLDSLMQSAGVKPQHLRAYRYWCGKRDIDTMCIELRVGDTKSGVALQRDTIITYVIEAIARWQPFQQDLDLAALRLFVQMDLGSWGRHFEALSRLGGFQPEKKPEKKYM
ncbi:ribonuclease H-like domain-containing protein [Mycena galericulata]|nr:ribonuclease H-like domain-containing protein [Mycena galericulata]